MARLNPPHCLTPRRGNSLAFLDDTYPAKNYRDGATVWWKCHNPNFSGFYRAMHFSAKRGIAIACRLSVCLSVRLWHWGIVITYSSKIISPLVSLKCSLLATPTWRVCSKGNTPKFWLKVTHPPVDLSVVDIRSQIAAEWLQIAQRSQWRAYRKPPSLFLMVPSLTPTTSPSPQNEGSMCPQHTHLCNPLHVWF